MNENAIQRTQGEDAFRLSHERYRDLVEHTRALLTTHDLEGNILSVNKWPLEVLGYDRETLLKMNIRDILAPEVRHLFDEYCSQIRTKGFASGLMVVQTSAAERRVWEYHNTLRTEGVEAPVVRGMAVDVTEQIRARRELKELQKRLFQSQKMETVGRLAGGIAHDFNNILMAITSYCELLEMRLSQDGTGQAYLKEILNAANEAASLVQQLLAFSRKQVLVPQVLDLNQVLIQMEDMLKRLAGEDVKVLFSLDTQLGLVKADPARMEQVILNLVANAREAMPQGGTLAIETTNTELDDDYVHDHVDATPGSFVKLRLTDSGYGMDRHTLSHVFDPFFTTREVGKGSGLGLSAVYGIIRQSGGFIFADSRPGQGASFEIFLPRVKIL